MPDRETSKEVINKFKFDSSVIVEHLRTLCDELENGVPDDGFFTDYSQKIDLLVNGASELGFSRIATVCSLGKTLAEREAKIENTVLNSMIFAVLVDCADMVDTMVQNINSYGVVDQTEVSIEAFVESMEWLNGKLNELKTVDQLGDQMGELLAALRGK